MFPEIEKPAQIGRVNKVNPKGVSLRTQLNTDPEIDFKGYESNGTIIDAVSSSYVLGPASISIHAKIKILSAIYSFFLADGIRS